MKRLAIVSSFSESCGNAAFTRVLQDSIARFTDVQVEVIELNLKLLQSIEPRVRHTGDQHIDELCRRLREFDAVNVQLEAGLYGTLPRDIVRRCRKIISANPATTVTWHSPRLISTGSPDIRAGIKAMFQLRLVQGLRQVMKGLMGDVHVRINRRMLAAVRKRNLPLIVHTQRAREQIAAMYGYRQVHVHPLQIVPADFVVRREVLDQLLKGLPISAPPVGASQGGVPTAGSRTRTTETRSAPDDRSSPVLIGIFGYISAYKGHLDALRALTQLPWNYKMLIFGRQHPQTVRTDGSVDPYLSELRNTIEADKRLRGRVFFMGELGDVDFLHVAGAVDVAWLPYYENGQDGSGIASICMDITPRVVCSASFAFDELFRMLQYRNVMRFDIGNHLELASKTLMILRQDAQQAPYADKTHYNLVSQARLYVQAAGLGS